MPFKCPGSQSFSQPHPEFIKCNFCGKEIEIWSDEVKTKCPACGKTVMRAGLQSCLGWCKYARECVGEDAYNKYMKTKGDKNAKQKNRRRPKRTDE
jgi:predicted RNA-binding Zn-ribbon protein involved in translation (DUF1610 family)